MSILLNDNLNVAAPRPVDSRFGPYADINAALTAIPSAKRYQGLVVGILTAGVVIEHWFKNGTDNADLIEKTSGTLTTNELTNLLGVANGVATLGSDAKLTSSQLPDITTNELTCLTTGQIAGLVPQLDSLGHISIEQLPPSILGALIFRGLWDADQNTTTNSDYITLQDNVGNVGDYFVVSVAGTTSLGGHADWLVGDLVIFQNGDWDKVPGHNHEVISVNGVAPVSGDVTLAPSDIGAVSTEQLTTMGGAAYSSMVVQLTTEGYLSLSQLPTGIGRYRGTWDASINEPQLSNDITGYVNGDYYVVSVAGDSSGPGGYTTTGGYYPYNWALGDIVIVVNNQWSHIRAGNGRSISAVYAADAASGYVLPDTDGMITITPANIGAVSAADLTMNGGMSEASKIPQLTPNGLINISQLPVTTSAGADLIPQLNTAGLINFSQLPVTTSDVANLIPQLNTAGLINLNQLPITTGDVANLIPQLNTAGLLNLSQLPLSLQEDVVRYKGAWDGTTDLDLLDNKEGDMWLVAALDGMGVYPTSLAALGMGSKLKIGDLLLFTNGEWQRILGPNWFEDSEGGAAASGYIPQLNGQGYISTQQLTVASTSQIGILQLSTAPGMALDAAGILSLSAATNTDLGGVIVGTGLSVDGSGTVSVSALPDGVVVDGGTY